MKTLAIVGAGSKLGLSVAKKFGGQGFRVALLARRKEALDDYVRQLGELNIEAAGFVANVTDDQQLVGAFTAIQERFGQVDVLEYSPSAADAASAAATTSAIALDHFKCRVLGAVTSVQQVLPGMLERGDGALFFITGATAKRPLAFMTPVSITNGGLRNYAYCLNQELGPRGIYSGTVCINVPMREADPTKVAALVYDMYEKRDRVEEEVGELSPDASLAIHLEAIRWSSDPSR